VLSWFFCEIVISSDFAVSFFYFMSGFIVMYALIKKYQRGAEELHAHHREGQNAASSIQMPRRISFYDEQLPMQDCESMSVPKLNKRTLLKQVLARWLRLAFPTYIIVLFTLSMYVYLGSGPAFYSVINYNIIEPLSKHWFEILLFVQNFLPLGALPGLYWLHFVANDL
jgi:hypothetical protein